MAILNPTAWTILGLILTLLGVLLLFRFGMPYRLRSTEGNYVVAGVPEKDRYDTAYSVFGWVGLVAIVIGTCCQIIGAYLSST